MDANPGLYLCYYTITGKVVRKPGPGAKLFLNWLPKMSRFLLACALALLVSPLAARPATAASATEVVERFQSTLISVMSNAQKLGYSGRYKRFKPAVEESHDLPGIARIAAGRYWDQFKSEQKNLFVETFSELSIATYASRFDGYSGETFKIISERKLDSGDVLVQSVLTQSDGEKTRFDYVLRQKDGRWAFINIIVDGVSDLAIKRAEYAGILRTEGADALTAKLKTRIARYADASATKK